MSDEVNQPEASAEEEVLEISQKQIKAMLTQYNFHRNWMGSFTKESENYRIEGAVRGMQILFEIMGIEYEKTPGVIESFRKGL